MTLDDFSKRKISLLQSIQKVIDAIDAEVDWFLIYLFEEDKEQMKQIINKLKQNGAEAVVLACTDLPILLKQDDVDIPVFDTVEILAEATVQYAIGKIGNEILE